MNHDTELAADRVVCKRCGTTRQKYVHLGDQACPVRQCSRAWAEVPEGTAAYAAWVRTLQAMHSHQRAVQEQRGDAAAGVAVGPAAVPLERAAAAEGLAEDAAAAVAVLAGDADGGEGQPPAPRSLNLRPFRSHVCVVSAQVEFCMRCMTKTPRFKAAANVATGTPR